MARLGHIPNLPQLHPPHGRLLTRRDACDLLCLDLPRAEWLRGRRVDEQEAHRLAEPFRVLGDPTRLMLALALREGGELCVFDLSWILERAQNLVSHHLRAPRTAGLVDYRRQGKMALYSLTAAGEALLELAAARQVARG